MHVLSRHHEIHKKRFSKPHVNPHIGLVKVFRETGIAFVAKHQPMVVKP
jgi:hypothetical protein